MLILPSGHNTFNLAQPRLIRKRTLGRSTVIKLARQILLVFQMVKLQKVKITVLKRFSPSEVFPESPVTSVGPMEHVNSSGTDKSSSLKIFKCQRVSALLRGFQSTAMYAFWRSAATCHGPKRRVSPSTATVTARAMNVMIS